MAVARRTCRSGGCCDTATAQASIVHGVEAGPAQARSSIGVEEDVVVDALPGCSTQVTSSRVGPTAALTERQIQCAAVATQIELVVHGFIERMDGTLENFVHDEQAPVLLAVHHTRLLHVIANFADADPIADPAGWLALVEREPDPARRMRQRLVDDTTSWTSTRPRRTGFRGGYEATTAGRWPPQSVCTWNGGPREPRSCADRRVPIRA